MTGDTHTVQEADRVRQSMHAFLQDLPFPVVVGNSDGAIDTANAPAVNALHLDLPNLPQHEPAGVTGLTGLFREAVQSEKSVDGEVTGPDGRTFAARVTLVPDVGPVAILQDRASPDELERRKQAIASMVSHDLKNPLAAIQGYANLVEKLGDLNDRQQKFLSRIRYSATRIMDLLKDLLDVAWVEAGMEIRREPADLTAITRAVADDYRAHVEEKSQTLALHVPDSPATITGDPVRLRQMLGHLVENAVSFTDEGGSIVVDVAHEADTLRLSVEDNGIGIAADDLEKVFDRHFQVDESIDPAKGNGLGLAIVKAIAEQHGGAVRAESELGKGSTFTVTLPTR